MRNHIKTAAAFGAAAILLGACGTEADTTVDAGTDAAATDAPAEDPTDAELATDMETEAYVAFANLADGDVVATSFEVTFEYAGVTPVAAGDPVEGEGHFHVIVDAPCAAEGEVIVNDETHLHFGDGATSATLELAAGEHTLCLQFADGVHTATALTQMVTITVE